MRFNVPETWFIDHHPDEYDELMSNFRDEDHTLNDMSDEDIVKKFSIRFSKDSTSGLLMVGWKGARSTYSYTEDGWQPVEE